MDGGGLHRKRPLIETLEVKGCKMQAADLIPLLACFVNKSFTGTTTPICSLSLAAFIWQIWILGTETVCPKKPKIFYCLAFYRKKFTHCYFRSIMPTWDEISTAPSCPCGCRSVVLLWLGVLENESVSQSCPALCDPTDCSLCPQNSPGKNTGGGSHSFLQGIFPTQGLNPGLPYCRQILHSLSHQGSPDAL